MQIKHIFFSERLGFRSWKSSDSPIYLGLSSDPTVMKFFPKQFWLDQQTVKQSITKFQKHFDEYGYTYFAVDLLETNEFIGFIGLQRLKYDAFFTPATDIGWRLSKEHWGRGYATEGAKRCLTWFFDNFKNSRVISVTPIYNKASERVMQKIGMKKIGEFDHPMIDEYDPLLRHVLYEIKKGDPMIDTK